jgi:hypothetical protein
MNFKLNHFGPTDDPRVRAEILRDLNRNLEKGAWERFMVSQKEHEKRVAQIKRRGIIMGIVLVVAVFLALFA